MKPDILYEDNDLIVCIKPAGIPTQSSRIGTPDLVSILKITCTHPLLEIPTSLTLP